MNGAASNYCYADDTIVNEYLAIWDISDAATIITTLTGIGPLKAALVPLKPAMKTVSKVVNVADPVTFAQAMIEAAISWPQYPWKDLDVSTMETEAANAAFGDLQNQLESSNNG
jgi:hypothetical protein